MKKLLLFLVTMLMPIMASAYDFEVDGICYTITSIGDLTVEVANSSNTETKSSNYEGDIIIPSSIVYNNVTFSVTGVGMAAFGYYEKRPGSESFGGTDKITSVSLPSTIKYLGTYSFIGCMSLKKIELPDNLTTIGYSAFWDCENLEEVLMGDKVEIISNNCFERCSSLKKIEIPKSVIEIRSEAFSGCKNLIEVNIPFGITTLPYNLFRNCSSLKTIMIPSSVTKIDYNAFEGCSSFTQIDIPEGVNSIGKYAFKDCTSLKEVILPSTLSSLQIGCFEGCNNLTDIKSKIRNPYDIDESNFPNLTYMFGNLYVPETSVSAYKATVPWNQFVTIKTLSGEIPETPKCATPTIEYIAGQLTFNCETEGVEFMYSVTPPSAFSSKGNDSVLPTIYRITVYATKEGYEDSDVATKEIEVSGGFVGKKGDVNEDGTVNGTDIQEVINIIIAGDDEEIDELDDNYIFEDSTYGNADNDCAPKAESGWELWNNGERRTPGGNYIYNGSRIYADLAMKGLKVGFYCGDEYSYIIYGTGELEGAPKLTLPAGSLGITYYASNWQAGEARDIHFQILDANDRVVAENVTYTSENKGMGGLRNAEIEAEKFTFTWNCPVNGQYKIKFSSTAGKVLIGNISIVRRNDR